MRRTPTSATTSKCAVFSTAPTCGPLLTLPESSIWVTIITQVLSDMGAKVYSAHRQIAGDLGEQVNPHRDAPQNGEAVQPLRGDRLEHLTPLCRQAAKWWSDNSIKLRGIEPEVPAAIYGRAADNWRP